MRAALAIAFVIVASAAHAGTYYVQSSTQACAHADELRGGKSGCMQLASNTAVIWDGARIDGFAAPAFDGDKARVEIGGRAFFVYANFLRALPARDPLRRDFTTAPGAIGCASPDGFEEARLAAIHRDSGWMRQTGCEILDAGTNAIRLAPAVAGAETAWKMRVRVAHDAPKVLWIEAASLR